MIKSIIDEDVDIVTIDYPNFPDLKDSLLYFTDFVNKTPIIPRLVGFKVLL